MTRDQLRQIIADAVGNPSSGNVHDAIDPITDAVNAALNGKAAPKVETRIVAPEETRDA